METAKPLGKAGYDIILNGINKAQADYATKELKDLGIKADNQSECCITRNN